MHMKHMIQYYTMFLYTYLKTLTQTYTRLVCVYIITSCFYPLLLLYSSSHTPYTCINSPSFKTSYNPCMHYSIFNFNIFSAVYAVIQFNDCNNIYDELSFMLYIYTYIHLLKTLHIIHIHRIYFATSIHTHTHTCIKNMQFYSA